MQKITAAKKEISTSNKNYEESELKHKEVK